jgi:hypothetical protein
MSANQIPHLGFKPAELPGRPRPHSCPRCWMNGGIGHRPAEMTRFARNELDYRSEDPRLVVAFKQCGYWSAKRQKHCASTDRVTTHGSIGPRCETHTP